MTAKEEKKLREQKRRAEFLKDCEPQSGPGLNRNLPPDRVPVGTLKGFKREYRDGKDSGVKIVKAVVEWRYE